MRVGNIVHVSGGGQINPTGAGNLNLGISLPIASNLAQVTDVGGACNISGGNILYPFFTADNTAAKR